MNKPEQSERRKQLEHGVREDGTVEGYMVETHRKFPMAVLYPHQWGYKIDHDNRFVAFVVDAGGVDDEVRLPFETVELLHRHMVAGPQPASATPEDKR